MAEEKEVKKKSIVKQALDVIWENILADLGHTGADLMPSSDEEFTAALVKLTTYPSYLGIADTYRADAILFLETKKKIHRQVEAIAKAKREDN